MCNHFLSTDLVLPWITLTGSSSCDTQRIWDEKLMHTCRCLASLCLVSLQVLGGCS